MKHILIAGAMGCLCFLLFQGAQKQGSWVRTQCRSELRLVETGKMIDAININENGHYFDSSKPTFYRELTKIAFDAFCRKPKITSIPGNVARCVWQMLRSIIAPDIY